MKGLKTKQRDDDDGMAITASEWNSRPAAVEQAYRRGFQQGLAEALYAIQSNATARQIEDFIYGPVHRWRWERRMRWGGAPQFNQKPSRMERRSQPLRPSRTT